MKVHTGTRAVFLCSRRSFPAVHEGTPPASMLRGTHGGPGPADNPHGGPAGRPNRSGSTPSRPVSAVVQGQDERITRDPAYTTYGWKCAPATKEKRGLAHVAAGAATALSCPGSWWGSSKQAPQAGPAGHTVPASCGQEPQKARPRLAWPGKRCSPVMGWPGACGKAHSFCAHAQQPCRGPWQVMVYREEGCAHCGDQESSMFRPSQTLPDRWVPQSLLAH